MTTLTDRFGARFDAWVQFAPETEERPASPAAMRAHHGARRRAKRRSSRRTKACPRRPGGRSKRVALAGLPISTYWRPIPGKTAAQGAPQRRRYDVHPSGARPRLCRHDAAVPGAAPRAAADRHAAGRAGQLPPPERSCSGSRAAPTRSGYLWKRIHLEVALNTYRTARETEGVERAEAERVVRLLRGYIDHERGVREKRAGDHGRHADRRAVCPQRAAGDGARRRQSSASMSACGRVRRRPRTAGGSGRRCLPTCSTCSIRMSKPRWTRARTCAPLGRVDESRAAAPDDPQSPERGL